MWIIGVSLLLLRNPEQAALWGLSWDVQRTPLHTVFYETSPDSSRHSLSDLRGVPRSPVRSLPEP